MSRRQKPARWIINMLPKKCVNCGATKDLNYHHIVPVVCGGNEVPSNIAVLCGKCHDAVHYTNTGSISHSQAAREGIQRAKANGVKFGKPPADYEKVMRLIAENSTQFNRFSETTEREIAAMAGVGYTCYCKCKQKLLDAMAASEWPYSWPKPRQVRNRPMYEWEIRRLRGETI